jgi:hypothetical protein
MKSLLTVTRFSCVASSLLLIGLPESSGGGIRSYPCHYHSTMALMFIYHLCDEQKARWWPQFRDIVSHHWHDDDDDDHHHHASVYKTICPDRIVFAVCYVSSLGMRPTALEIFKHSIILSILHRPIFTYADNFKA